MEDKEFVNLTPETENTVGVSAAENEELRSAAVNDEKTAVAEAAMEDEISAIEAATDRTLSPGRLVMKRFFRSKLSMTGLIILIVLFVFSFLGPLCTFLPFIWPEQTSDYSSSVREEYFTEVKVPETGESVYVVTYSEPSNYLKPSITHLLGTDDKGYDVFTRLMYGGRISLTVGFVVVILETIIGIILGGLGQVGGPAYNANSGYFQLRAYASHADDSGRRA